MNSWNREDACGSAQTDYGADPIAANVIQAARENRNFRTAFWTGRRLQMTLMESPVHGDIGVEMHPETDQVIRVEEGRALVCMGCAANELEFRCCLCAGEAVFIPGGIWHNVLNAGSCPLKLSSCYAPPQHPHGTIHRTKADGAHEGH